MPKNRTDIHRFWINLITLVSITTTYLNASLVQAQNDQDELPDSILSERSQAINKAVSNPFSISQHRVNYILPITHVGNPNTISADGLNSDNVDNFEAKYQISMKLPIYQEDESTSGLYFGFTAVSFWQLYNSDVSKPFRETNYEPEVFYSWRNELSFAGFRVNQVRVGFNHQSNGQTGPRSRSWDRIFGSVMFSDEESFYYVKAWYRINEDEKEGPFDATGDDNPDITTFLGHIELGYGTQFGDFNITGLVRNNLKTSDNKGSIEVNLTYPINNRYDFLVQYFNGYGDSLIDYNRHQQRFGVGLQLRFL